VPAGLDGERRFCVAEVNSARRGDKEFFGALHRQMEDGGTAGLLYDLLTMPLGDWAPRDGVPDTKGLVEQKLRSMGAMDAWWYSRLQEGWIPNTRPGENWEDGEVTILKEYLRRDYAASCKEAGWGRVGSETEFGMKMTKMVPGIRARQTKATQDEYGVRADRHGRATAYVVPRLAECREAFSRGLGGKLQWQDPIEQEAEA
jgi:hypothetical protein